MTNPDIHLKRLDILREAMAGRDLDAVVVRTRINSYYYTGFRCTYSILIIDKEKATFITDSRYSEAAERELPWLTVKIQPGRGVAEFLKDVFRSLDYHRVGIEDSITLGEMDDLEGWAPGTLFSRAGELITEQRAVKDAHEISIIRRAVALADRMMEQAMERARPGVVEKDLSRAIRFSSEELGGDGESFPNIIASGPNSSSPHHHPGVRALAAGDALTIDLGGVVDGYCSDLTRNPFIGKPVAELEKIYNLVLEANRAAIDAIRPGMTGIEIDAIAREIIEKAGYGTYFGHGLGHGVGLEIHEAPRLSPMAKSTRLMAGNIVTIEPGIYVPGLGGVRIEDYVLLTDQGAEVLSASPKELRVLPA